MSALYYIVCNGCGVVSQMPSRTSLASARRMLAPHGWTNPTRGADFCAKCSAARAARAKKENPNGYL